MRHAFDLIVVGAGIVGLACARAASERGWRVLIIDREQQAIGASIRNFGFITVTGQRAGRTWERAMRTRDLWEQICPRAGIPILQRGLLLAAHEQGAESVLDEFLKTSMGERLLDLSAGEACERVPALRRDGLRRALFSPHELRIDPRTAIAALANWLRSACSVQFLWETVVRSASEGQVETNRGTLYAERIAICPGPDLRTLFPDVFERRQTTLCKLQMLRLAPRTTGRLPHPVMGDLSLVRYAGYAELPAAQKFRSQIEQRFSLELENGIHIIAVQSADGTLTIGDSHHYSASPDPFQSDEVDRLILAQAGRLIEIEDAQVVDRWTGVYPSSNRDAFIDAPAPTLRVVSVTSGTGMSTGLAIGEEVISDWH